MLSRQRSRGRRPSAEGGSATVFLLAMIPVFVILLGLVYDSGRAYTAHTRALNLAEQAARTGAQKLDLATVRGAGPYKLDRAAAEAAARSFLSGAGQPGSVSIGPGGDTVQVTVTWQITTTFLGIVGINQMGSTATASAQIVVGV